MADHSEAGAGDSRLALYNAVKALHGYGDPVNQKTASRGVTGFFQKVVGSNPKFSFFQRNLISKPMDSVARGTITVNPDLGIDEVGIPEDEAWKMYQPYIQRRLVQLGYSPADAVLAIKDRSKDAKQALESEMHPDQGNRPVLITRAPAWHKFNTVAQYPRLTQGHTIEINPFITTGMNADSSSI